MPVVLTNGTSYYLLTALTVAMPNFTTDHLLLYLYNESTASQKKSIEEELKSNWALHEKLLVLKESVSKMEGYGLKSPRQSTINAILKYAAGTAKEFSR